LLKWLLPPLIDAFSAQAGLWTIVDRVWRYALTEHECSAGGKGVVQ
jgi:hypothetical protein